MRIRPRARHAAAALVLATALTVVATAPAEAQIAHFDDPSGDSGSVVDFTRATVAYNKVLRVAAAYPDSTLDIGTRINVWLDTKRADPGPEYRVSMLPNTDFLQITPVERFGGPAGDPVRCRSFRAHADVFDDSNRVWIKMKATCVDAPSSIRVAVEAKRRGDVEWIKARNTFLPRVQRF